MTTAVPQIQFTPEGLVLPEESAILAGAQADIQAAFAIVGANINPTDLRTPAGQIASTETELIGSSNNEIAFIVNGVNPLTSTGFMQDALGLIYGMTRKPALHTTVTCELVGLSGTFIPGATIAYDTNNNKYVCVTPVTIGPSGSVDAVFQNILPGAIGCPDNTLTTVGQTITGWDSINNSASGVVGNDVETTQEFEFRRQQSVALNATGTVQAILANVFNVENVSDCYVIDNPLGSVVNTGPTNYPLLPHSLYVAVVGGLPQDIAQAIWIRKDVGCDYNVDPGVGATPVTVVVQDTVNYSPPYPSYNVTYLIPDPTEIYFVVTIASIALLPANVAQLIKNSIVATFNGTNNAPPARIGASIFSSTYYCAISAISPYIAILSLNVGTSPSPISALVEIGIDQVPVLSPSNIVVIIS